ncbi:Uncharacterized protein HZ326_26639 [Fusarium oxysporum f. sp. albedinis]|nr:Uncharacterized protein HZ326_26639 [Fusarium oxysporum f. sp. albedinis]
MLSVWGLVLQTRVIVGEEGASAQYCIRQVRLGWSRGIWIVGQAASPIHPPTCNTPPSELGRHCGLRRSHFTD